MSTFKDRLLTEKQELNEKISKLSAFITGPNFATVDTIQQSLLRIQLSAMITYADCLEERITFDGKLVFTYIE
jgi:hypothetical protein